MYYIFILHQTTTIKKSELKYSSCIISSFYIKPQQGAWNTYVYLVVLYLHSTSNHNYGVGSFVSHLVVLYLHSTSNHNFPEENSFGWKLYYIFILHQTTTGARSTFDVIQLYYIFILHQTTTFGGRKGMAKGLYYIFILHQTTTPPCCSRVKSGLYYIFILHQTTTCRSYFCRW